MIKAEPPKPNVMRTFNEALEKVLNALQPTEQYRHVSCEMQRTGSGTRLNIYIDDSKIPRKTLKRLGVNLREYELRR